MRPVNAVREDPVRKGLLFAGTERAVYVSFNDGDDWQPLRLNMPATSIRDLVVHDNDLVVGTHGRGFWILDDIAPLRQLTAEVVAAPAHLFAPQPAYRYPRNTNTDTPLPPEEPAGQNPPDGAILYYNLKSAASSPVVIDILDSTGKVLARFESTDQSPAPDPLLNVPTYWIRPFARPGGYRRHASLRLGSARRPRRRRTPPRRRVPDLRDLPGHPRHARRMDAARHLHRQAHRRRPQLHPALIVKPDPRK